MITRLEATRYRCFERLGIDLGAFQVIVGANGSGKSTLLDVPDLLRDMLRSTDIALAFFQKREDALPRVGSAKELLFAGKGTDFSIAVEARLPDDVASAIMNAAIARQKGDKARLAFRSDSSRWHSHLRYEIAFEVNAGGTIQVRNEYLFLFPNKHAPDRNEHGLHGPRVPANKHWLSVLARDSRSGATLVPEVPHRKPRPLEPVDMPGSVLALPRVLYESSQEFPAARWLFSLLTEGTVFLEPNWQEMRPASLPGQPSTVIRSGRNIPWLALSLRNEGAPEGAPPDFRSERYGDWIAHVRTALPQVVDIEVREREDDHYAYFRVVYRGGFSVPQSSLSDGTLRILALTLLPYLSKQPTVLVTEEPENGIHPQGIMAVMQSLSSMYETQVLVSSHSPLVLANVKIDHLLCAVQTPDGAVSVIAGRDHPQLTTWRGEVSLGTLFAAGILG